MAETVGVSRSAVSRQIIEASETKVEALLSRRFEEVKMLVIYIDGLIFGDYTMAKPCGSTEMRLRLPQPPRLSARILALIRPNR